MIFSHIRRAKEDKFEKQNRVGQLTASSRGEQKGKVLNSEIYLYCAAAGSREQIISRRSQSQHMQSFPQIKQIRLSLWAAREHERERKKPAPQIENIV